MSIKEVDYIWKNGELVNWEQANIHILTHAIHYGTGVFEGIRGYWSGDNLYVFRLEEHIDRLFESSKLYFMDPGYTKKELSEATLELLRENKIESDCYIRPLVYRGYGKIGLNPLEVPVDTAIIGFPFGKYIEAEGARCCISSWRRIPTDVLPPESKACGNYINSVLAKVEAVKNGFDEAIFLDHDGYVSEGSGENLFIVKNNVVLTPPAYSSILIGITRDTVMKLCNEMNIKVEERPITRTELIHADEAFFSGTAAEITPIVEVDHHTIGIGDIGKVTKKLMETFHEMVRGKTLKHTDWLTPVYS
ncbi:branched-chain amino acid transaminase [Candidatus Bathyarchaeota archaeon]|nr:branched-chain amino acid transaminase [Candidatus Bathyarchaeota archaeon]